MTFLALLVRAGLILITPPSADVLSQLAQRQYHRSIDLSPYRGTIFDRRGEPLAISIRKPSLFINPRVFDPSPTETKALGKILDIPPNRIRKAGQKRSYFSWIKRKIDSKLADQAMALNIDGLHSVLEPSRYYPSGLASQLIGYVGTDNKGLLGLELRFDETLRGNSETNLLTRDARGKIIRGESDAAEPQKPGQKIYLTLDRVVQEISEKALERGIKNAEAKSGFAIVSDPHTGHILAIANYPKFNPNDSSTIDQFNTRNHGLMDLYEPGSVVKPFVVARALALGKTSMAEAFETHKGLFREGSLRIRDSHPSEELSTAEIIIESSNIGTYKIAKKMGPQALYQVYEDFGLGEAAFKTEAANQAAGRMMPWQKWREVRFANISFGQGLMMTGLEIVQAYGAIANGGQLMKPILVERIEDHKGQVLRSQNPTVIRRVLPHRVAKVMSKTLAEVVEVGTGSNAKSSDYHVAGKTGTSEKVDPETRRYAKHLRIASFAGFSPVKDPHLVIYVVIDEPRKKPYYGGVWAAPVFKEINEKSLRYLNVAPSKRHQATQPLKKAIH
ncbi:peptidoglycan D,D-transpeptidase FtsI family protein [Pseudobacteriovorax antillogorgiicola]|nr:penicillin-binding protein 2 [Pseudobacteriovorax antillogorgiicola]